MLVALGLVLLLAAWAVAPPQRVRRCLAELLALPADYVPAALARARLAILERSGIAGIAWEGGVVWRCGARPMGQRMADHWPARRLSAGPDCRIELRWADVAHRRSAGAGAGRAGRILRKPGSRMRRHAGGGWRWRSARRCSCIGSTTCATSLNGVGAGRGFGAATPEQLPRLAQRLAAPGAGLLQARALSCWRDRGTNAGSRRGRTARPGPGPVAQRGRTGGPGHRHRHGPQTMAVGCRHWCWSLPRPRPWSEALDKSFPTSHATAGTPWGRAAALRMHGAWGALQIGCTHRAWPHRGRANVRAAQVTHGLGHGAVPGAALAARRGGDLRTSEGSPRGVVFVLRVPLASSERATAEASNLTVAGPDASVQ